MIDTVLLLATMPAHLGVPLADLVAWAVALAFLAAPAPYAGAHQNIVEIGGAKPRRAAPRRQSDTPAQVVAIAPPAARLTVADQWQAMSRVVSDGAERVMAVAREQQSLRRELDSLDLTMENLRRELASVMSIAVPVPARSAELVAMPVRHRVGALAA
jgi:hypothetical protein